MKPNSKHAYIKTLLKNKENEIDIATKLYSYRQCYRLQLFYFDFLTIFLLVFIFVLSVESTPGLEGTTQHR